MFMDSENVYEHYIFLGIDPAWCGNLNSLVFVDLV